MLGSHHAMPSPSVKSKPKPKPDLINFLLKEYWVVDQQLCAR